MHCLSRTVKHFHCYSPSPICHRMNSNAASGYKKCIHFRRAFGKSSSQGLRSLQMKNRHGDGNTSAN